MINPFKKIRSVLKSHHYIITIIEAILIVLIPLGGYTLLKESYNLSGDIEPSQYFFHLNIESNDSSRPQPILDHFLLEYDFTTQQGIISFRPIINKTDNILNKIRISFPRLVSSSNLEVKTCEYRDCSKSYFNMKPTDVNYVIGYGNKELNSVEFYEFPKSITNDNLVIINFESYMYPFGSFSIFPHDSSIHHMENEAFYHEGVHLLMGEDYRCSKPCFLNNENTEQDLDESTEKKIRISLNKEDSNNFGHSFGVYGVNEANLKEKNLNFGIGVSLMASFIVLAISFFIKKLEEMAK